MATGLAPSPFIPALPGKLFGLEHEYEVLNKKQRVDFRPLVHKVAQAGEGSVCSAGPEGYFLPSGTLLICDGWEAELAAPPELVRRDLFQTIPNLARNRELDLLNRLQTVGEDQEDLFALRGYSTHFSVSSAGVNLDALARVYTETVAPGMMMLLDHATSPGLLVRARRRRFEIGGDYLPPGDHLRAASLFFVASYLYALDCLLLGGPDCPRLLFDTNGIEPTIQRRGLYVDRLAYGDDLYEKGRSAILRLRDGGLILAQDALERLWREIRPFADSIGGEQEVLLVDDAVTGNRFLPLETDSASLSRVTPIDSSTSLSWSPRHPFADCLQTHILAQLTLNPSIVTWDYIVYRVIGKGPDTFLNIPRERMADWLNALHRGNPESWMADEASPVESILASPGQAQHVGRFETVDSDALAECFGGRKKKKKKDEDGVCRLVIDKEGNIEICMREVRDPQRIIAEQEPPQNGRRIAHDVWVNNGAFGHEHVDHRVRSLGLDFLFLRYYRSGIEYDGPLGQIWDHAYNIRIVPHPPPNARQVPDGWCEPFNLFGPNDGSSLTYYEGNGRLTEHPVVSSDIRVIEWCDAYFAAIVFTYAQNDGDQFEVQRYVRIAGTLPPAVTDDIFFRVMYQGGNRLLFDCCGRLKEIRNPQHETTRLAYGLPLDPGTNCFVLRKVTDSLQRPYTLEYVELGGKPRLVSVTDQWQRRVGFGYDTSIQLEKVTLATGFAGTPQIQYRYGGGQRPGLLREIINPNEAAGNGPSWLENTYDSRERIVSQRVGSSGGLPAAGGTYRIRYPDARRVFLRDRAGTNWSFFLKAQASTRVLERVRVTDQVGTNGTVLTKTLDTQMEYDRHFHVSRMIHPSGREEIFRHRNRNQIVRDGDELDDVLFNIAHYNDLGRDALMRHEQKAPGGGPTLATTYGYEWLFGAMRWNQSPLGTTLFTYDHGRCNAPRYNAGPVRIDYPPQRQPDGSLMFVFEEFDYAPGGVVNYRKDPDGVEHRWDIDAAGRVKRYTIGGLNEEELTYDPRGNIESRTNNRGKIWKFTYDMRDLMLTATDPLGHLTEFRYDLNDRRGAAWKNRVDDPTTIPGLTPSPPARIFDIYRHDILGNRTSHTEVGVNSTGATSRTWRWTYDMEERLRLHESARATALERPDAKVRTAYNARGLPREVVTAEGGPDAGRTRTYYDDDGHEALIIDPVGLRTVYRYDGLGRLVTETRPDGTIRHLEYRGAVLRREWVEGPLSTRPPQLGGSTVTRVLREIQVQVDASQRPIRRTLKVFDPRQRPSITSGGGGNWTEETWFSPAGRVTRQRDPAGHEAVFTWNAQGRLEQLTMPGGDTLRYTYDGDLIRTVTTTVRPDPGITGPLPPGNLTLQESNTYDDLGRMISHQNAYGMVIQQAWDSMDHLRAKRSPLLQGRQVLTQRTYDLLGRMVTQTTDNVASASNPDAMMSLVFQYDLNDNSRLLVDDLGRRTACTYDGRDLLLTMDQPDQRPLTYRRRRDGRVRTVSRAGGSVTTLGYTSSGAVSSATHSGGGNPMVRQRFGYDGLNQLWWASDSNGGSTFRVQTYRAFDSLGRLLSERTVIPEHSFDRRISYRYQPGQRWTIYPDAVNRVRHDIGGDGHAKRISLGSNRLLWRAWHQGPGRLLQTHRFLQLQIAQPTVRAIDLIIRTSERYDTFGRQNFRVLHVTDEINRPGQSNFLPLGTQAEQTSYQANGMPRRRDYGVITQPGVSVDSTTVYDGLGRARLVTEGEGQDFLNFDYDWDGAGRLREFELNGRQGGQIVDERTTMSYQSSQRTDRRTKAGNPAGTTTWTFDSNGRVIGEVTTDPAGRRAFVYDAADRLIRVDVFTPGLVFTTQQTSRFLYDAFARPVARTSSTDPEFFTYEGHRIIEEFNANRATRRYVYDDEGLVLHYAERGNTGPWRGYYPLVTAEGSPWVLLADQPQVTTLPTPPGAQAASVTRSAYFREKIPLIVEEDRRRLFEKGIVIAYDYSGGTASGSRVDASVMPLDSAGRRYFATEKLFLNGPRFYDPALRNFIIPDSLGSWGHPSAFGNPYAYAANNPFVFNDDGNHPLVVGLLVVAAVGALLGAGINAARQGVQLLEGSRDSFSLGELGFSAFLGGVLAPAFVFAPELVIPAIGVGLGFSISQYRSGEIGGATLAFDVATMAIPFGFKGVRQSVFGRKSGSLLARGATAGLAERAGRFSALGTWTMARLGRRTNVSKKLNTLDMLRELGGREIEEPVPPADLELISQNKAIGEGQQGEVFRVVGSRDNLVVKVFDKPSGADAAGEIAGLYEFHAALGARDPATAATQIRVVRVTAMGRTTTGKTFLIKEFAEGKMPPAMFWLEEGGHAELIQALIKINPQKYQKFPQLYLYKNLVMDAMGQIIIFDPM